MRTQNSTLETREWTTPAGQLVRLAYDPEADVLEVSFPGVEEDDVVDLTQEITLHVNAQHNSVTGITFLSYLQLSQPGEWGECSFPITGLDRLPASFCANILRMLNAAPANHFLRTAA